MGSEHAFSSGLAELNHSAPAFQEARVYNPVHKNDPHEMYNLASNPKFFRSVENLSEILFKQLENDEGD